MLIESESELTIEIENTGAQPHIYIGTEGKTNGIHAPLYTLSNDARNEAEAICAAVESLAQRGNRLRERIRNEYREIVVEYGVETESSHAWPGEHLFHDHSAVEEAGENEG